MQLTNDYQFQYQLLMRNKLKDIEAERPFFDSKQAFSYPSKRSSLNLPDISAVLENNNNNNLMDTNEISWLQKIAIDNEKVNDSRLLDENIMQFPASNPTNQMKFSFNMNYDDISDKIHTGCLPRAEKQKDFWNCPNQSKKINKENQFILADILNTSCSPRVRKNCKVGSIKKNPKAQVVSREISEHQRQIAENTSFSKLQQMNQRLNKALKKEKLYITSIPNKQNIKKQENSKSKCSINVKTTLSTQKIGNNTSEQDQGIQNQNIIEEKFNYEKQDISFQRPTLINKINQKPCLETLFNKLDRTQTGKLSRQNCYTDIIPQQLKYIFGNIFTKIKFKQLILNKRQFVKICDNVIKQLDSQQIIELLNRFETNEKELEKERNKDKLKERLINDEIWPSIKQEIRIDKEPLLQTFQPKQFKSSHISSSAKKYNSKDYQKKVATSTEKGRLEKNQSSVNHMRKYNSIQKSFTIKQNIFDNILTQYLSKKQANHFNSGKQSQYEYSSYSKKMNGNQSTIEQHKRGLFNLNNLNKRIQSCLNTNIFSQQNKSSIQKQESLSFDQLVKHI